MSTEPWTALGAAISAIRRELTEAIADGANSGLKFRTGPIELEFSATIHTDAEGRVKVLLLPWGVDAKVGGVSDRTQRIRFTLHPIEADTGWDAEINAESERPR